MTHERELLFSSPRNGRFDDLFGDSFPEIGNLIHIFKRAFCFFFFLRTFVWISPANDRGGFSAVPGFMRTIERPRICAAPLLAVKLLITPFGTF